MVAIGRLQKPKIPKSNNALVGLYKITHPEKLAEALDYIIKTGIKSQNEYHLTDALMHLIMDGEKMVTCEVDHWYDCGRKETVLHANAVLLNRPEFKQTNHPEFPNTIIIPPVSIGEGCTITNSIIGPNVAIGHDTIIDYTILRDTIIGAYSELKNTVMHDSIIGNDASLKGLSHSLSIGDSTEINFNER